ncbi:MAG: hypothetical protein ABIJ96_07850 [Elusimicrobiota bacterium]
MDRSLIAAALLLLAGGVYAGPVKYNAGEFTDTAKMAKKLTAGKQLKKLKKWNVSNIIITECVGEFMQSREVSAGAMESRWSDFTIKTQSTIDLGGDYYNSVADRVYTLVQKAFEDNGFSFVSKESLMENERYQKLNLEFEKKTRGYTGGVMKQSVTTKGMKRSATGLGIYPSNPLTAIKLAVGVADMTAEIKADSAMRIKFYVDKGKNGTPVLKTFEVLISGDLRGEEVGFKGHKKMSYGFRRQDENIFALEKPITSTVDIQGEGKGSVDMKKYDEALFAIVGSVVDMLGHSLKEASGA